MDSNISDKDSREEIIEKSGVISYALEAYDFRTFMNIAKEKDKLLDFLAEFLYYMEADETVIDSCVAAFEDCDIELTDELKALLGDEE